MAGFILVTIMVSQHLQAAHDAVGRALKFKVEGVTPKDTPFLPNPGAQRRMTPDPCHSLGAHNCSYECVDVLQHDFCAKNSIHKFTFLIILFYN